MNSLLGKQVAPHLRVGFCGKCWDNDANSAALQFGVSTKPMFRSALVIALAMTPVMAADFSGRWAGTLETNGNRVPIYLVLSEHDGRIDGSVASGSRMPTRFAPYDQNTFGSHSGVTGDVPAMIEKSEVRNGELLFEVHDNAQRLIQFRLTLTNGVLSGNGRTGMEVSKVAVVAIDSGPGFGAAGGGGDRAPHVEIGPQTGGSTVGSGVYRVGGGVSAPILTFKTQPDYTEEARAAKLQGTVVLYVQIPPDGAATNIKVVKSLGLGLDEKAIEAVQKWRFNPGKKDGLPVTVEATIEVNFRL